MIYFIIVFNVIGIIEMYVSELGMCISIIKSIVWEINVFIVTLLVILLC